MKKNNAKKPKTISFGFYYKFTKGLYKKDLQGGCITRDYTKGIYKRDLQGVYYKGLTKGIYKGFTRGLQGVYYTNGYILTRYVVF